MEYSPQKIEKKWQKIWQKKGTFQASVKTNKPKFYCLDMFPYPSAEGIHVGHLKGYTFSDLLAKKKLMEGFNVLHPMGWDAFGLPAENFAIKTGIHPAKLTAQSIKNIKKQLLAAGFGYDWQREIQTSKPEYYKWTQWLFLRLYKAGLAYQKNAAVNFCPSCKTVLANEQTIEGRCERCSSLIEKKYLKQWFFKTTSFAEKLLDGLEKLDWPEKIKIMQRNWIGRSEGAEIQFRISDSKQIISVFTTRIDTLFGCSYIVIAPEHQFIKNSQLKIKNLQEVEQYIKDAGQKTEIERLAENKEKTGVELKGLKAINPVNEQELPIFVSDYVLTEYGTGAIMAVPGHDQRDLLFAQKHNIPFQQVIVPEKEENENEETQFSFKMKKAFEKNGILINSGPFSGLTSAQAKKEIIKYLEQRNAGKAVIHYKLRDWLVSRQRYWGAPIPIIHCPRCGKVAVSETDLPVKLPLIKDFKPTGEGKSPLAKNNKFVNVKCPKCKRPAKRETDTMDTFVCSSWYFLRYADPKNRNKFARGQKIKKWLPVNLYVGGAEHAVMHLLYARFFIKFLFEQRLVNFKEPFLKLFNQGMIYRQGAKMSKSKGNVITPDSMFKKFGADTARLYEIFMGPSEQASEWSDKGINGCHRFLKKIWRLSKKTKPFPKCSAGQMKIEQEKLLHKTIKRVSEDIDNFKFNTAVSSLMILSNEMEKYPFISNNGYQTLLKLLAPMAPHISEELWQKSGKSKSIFWEKWPKYDKQFIKEEKIQIIIQINGKIRDKIETNADIRENEARELTLRRKKVKKWTDGKKIKKIVFVPKKLINIVV